MSLEQTNWFKVALRVEGSVIPNILNQVLWCGAFGLFISVLSFYKIPVGAKALGGIIPSIVLGLLLVFRTNTAYERFWEGRKAWGSIVNNVRNLSRLIWVAIIEIEPMHRQEKEQILKLLVAFSIATKLHLRSQPVDDRLAELVSPIQFAKLQTMSNPPLEIVFWISDYLQAKHEQGQISLYQMNELQSILNILVDMLGACERILRTPIPLAYVIHLKQLLLIYCLLLPFQVVDELRWWTAPVVALVSFTLFGIEAIGVEIENPFGTDPNDLPLDNICNTISRNIDDLISIEPHYRRSGIYGGDLGEQLN
ncbi:bestrophin family ion channel [Chamaesiphon sp. VAR_48_metabat_135_sub]|uniref:bestrophin family protein n=1 Tax=Chamaesiphon sp. VAR_48_metabat_135_sub TaxID=2964699 RepID=UPI00286BBA4D|nr:bestrophin family ion channel [Chamaesiphon sp. VAR_48_metabat_135_sub]